MAFDFAKLLAVCIAKPDDKTRNARNGVTSDACDVTPYVMTHVTRLLRETVVEGGGVTLRAGVTPETPAITPVTPVTCQKPPFGFGFDLGPNDDVERDIKPSIVERASWQHSADERNAAAALAGRTERYCSCQREATVAVGRRRTSPANPEGVDRWLCAECFDTGTLFPTPVSRRSSPGIVIGPPIEMTIVARPEPHAARTPGEAGSVERLLKNKPANSPMVGVEMQEIHPE